MSLQLFNGANIGKVVQANDLIVVEAATITVKNLSGDLVSIFEDKQGAIPQVNPFTADQTGSFKFYIAVGEYHLTIVKGGVTGEMFIELGAGGEVTLINVETNALVIGPDNHGSLFNISDLTGSVSVTIDPVPTESIGNITFISSDTDSPIEFVAGVGLDPIQTSKSLVIDEKYITVAVVYMSETTARLMGDLAP